jgi:hypothetical protein
MNPVAEEYKRQAAYCEAMADSASSREIKAEWLRLAGNWLAMVPYRESAAPHREPALPEDLVTMAQEKSARQEDSTTSR